MAGCRSTVPASVAHQSVMLLPTGYQLLRRAVKQGHYLGLIDASGGEGELTYCARANGA
jgi:hypothetical protein